jgi:hypothetical protein
MGFFGRRVTGLGLPLMQILTVSQLKGVIAHECGHFHGGDTRLGPWIYKTHHAIGRTITSLGDGWLHIPFLWYGNLFLRITHAISRRQELAADALAAKVAGAKALIEGLKRVHRGGLAHDLYWRGEYLPAVAAGFKPPLTPGFERFLANESLEEALEKAMAEELAGEAADPYDTHPPLPRRIAALKRLQLDDRDDDGRSARTLLAEERSLDDELLECVVVPEHMATLTAIEWGEAVTKVYLPQWEEVAEELESWVPNLSTRRIPTDADGFARLADRLTYRDLSELPTEVVAHDAACRVGAALAVALIRRGWKVTGDVGDPFCFEKDGHGVQLFRWLNQLVDGELEPETWRAFLEEAGIERLRVFPKGTEPSRRRLPKRRRREREERR